MNVEATATSDTDRAYSRSRRLSLWGLLVALPLSLWVAIGDNWVTYVKKNHEDILDAPAGAAFSFEGSSWRLETVEALPAVPTSALPPNTTRVLMRVSVTPGDAAAVERLSQCLVWLSSKDDRRWVASADVLREARSPTRVTATIACIPSRRRRSALNRHSSSQPRLPTRSSP